MDYLRILEELDAYCERTCDRSMDFYAFSYGQLKGMIANILADPDRDRAALDLELRIREENEK